jgi:protease IV
MKSFLKYVLATIVGIVVSSIILFLLFVGIISAVVSSQQKTVEIKSNSILCLKLDQQIVDRKPSLPFNISTLRRVQKTGLNDLLQNISKAKEDPKIKGILLELNIVQAGYGTVEEIRNAILDFRKSGKFVIVYSEMLSQKAYYLATAADKIYLNPGGFFEWVGLRIQSPFFKNALKKLDIEATVVRYGKYKSAAEQFSESEYSKENAEQLQQLISTIWTDIRAKISASRNISVDRLNEIANKLLVNNSMDAYKLGFVDSLIYKDQLIALLKERTGIDESDDLNSVALSEYSKVPMPHSYKGIAKNKIAILYASGDIISGNGDEESIGSDKFAESIRKARKDSSIKAVVVRVNSPGGSALASDIIWRELYLTRQTKPVVVSMGDLAASGGYYISCMADTIVAQPGTISGSIGVIGMYLNTQGFFNKLGISFDAEKTNPYADFLSGVRPVSDLELKYWQTMIDTIYATFVRRVDEGRPLTYSEIDQIGQGRVWSGTDAVKLGLVDKIGGLQDAVEIARKMAGLDEKFRLVELPEQEDALTAILKSLTQDTRFSALQKKLGADGDYLMVLKKLIENQGILTRMPYDIYIN